MDYFILKIGKFCEINDNSFIKINRLKGNFTVLSYDKSRINLKSNITLIIINQSSKNDFFCKVFINNNYIYVIEKSKLKLSNETRKKIVKMMTNQIFGKIKNEL